MVKCEHCNKDVKVSSVDVRLHSQADDAIIIDISYYYQCDSCMVSRLGHKYLAVNL